MYKKNTYSIINSINYFSKYKSSSIKLSNIISNKYLNNYNLRNKLLHKELPIRLAHRINDLQLLPYDFLKNKTMSSIFDIYINSFDILYNYNLKENDLNYINLLNQILINHENIEERMAYSIFEFKNKNNIISNDLINITMFLGLAPKYIPSGGIREHIKTPKHLCLQVIQSGTSN